MVIEQLHQSDQNIPKRLIGLSFFSTIITHLFGGSAGKEAIAVQIGSAITGIFNKYQKFNKHDKRLLIMSGIAAGFGAIFGTPISAAIFASEVLYVGQIEYASLLPCFIAAILGRTAYSFLSTYTIHQLQIHAYPSYTPFNTAFEWVFIPKLILIACIFGIAARTFCHATFCFKKVLDALTKHKALQAGFGGLIIVCLVLLLGTQQYIGLGDSSPNPHEASIESFFANPSPHDFAWFWKIIFTTITVASGFRAGEVSPLFYIGSALGNTLSLFLHCPHDLLAALGFVSLLAAAGNVPVACTMMGIELFGTSYALWIALSCWIAYYCSGHSSIFNTQKITVPKNLNTESHA